MTSRRNQRSPEAAAYRAFYKTARWARLRIAQLRAQPLCEPCLAKGRVTAATVAHHKQEHKGDARLFYDALNLESVCKPCHDGPAQQRERIGYSTEIGADGWPVDEANPANR